MYKSNKTAYKCLHCDAISIFKGKAKDGRNCIKCKGCLLPIGEAYVDYEEKLNKANINMKVKVDTRSVDIALNKINRLERKVSTLKSKGLIR
ncbi:MAG: hypothetical protein RR620_11900 [Clostridium sp.]